MQEADYLLGVHDAYRIGGLRLRLEASGPFLDDQHGRAAPPMTRVRELEAASLALERDEANRADGGDEWLRMLIAPGGSLGGARPKASVLDHDGSLWIAKFPSTRDQHDQGAWELITLTLAQVGGLRVPRAKLLRLGHQHHTYLVERFDRSPTGARRHFASAMTLTGRTDGDDAATGVSYLDLADVIMRQGVDVDADLRELWTRIVFNMLVSNTDDHLRNHGFLLVPQRGWALSPAYDMNPVPLADGLKLNVNERDNALDVELAREVAPIFRVSDADAAATIARLREVVRSWPRLAERLGIAASEQERMAQAFDLA
jgi:serine/threonine-protein kinase HipA